MPANAAQAPERAAWGAGRDGMVPALRSQGDHPMTKLTDTQLIILTAACQRPNRLILPLPKRLKGGAAQKVVAALISRGLVEETAAGPDDPVWRDTGDGHGVTLAATDAALASCGVDAASGPTAAPTGAPAPAESPPQDRRRRSSRQRVTQRRCGARPARGRSRPGSSRC